MPTAPQYTYRAIVTDVIDGDTVVCDIDLGMCIWKRGERIRLCGINAPEMRGPEASRGQASRDYLISLLDGNTSEGEEGYPVILTTTKDRDDKYGRLLGTLYAMSRGEPLNLNERMVQAGHAMEYMR